MNLFNLIIILFLSVLASFCSKKETNKTAEALMVQQMTPKPIGFDFDELSRPIKYEDFTSIRVSPRARIKYSDGTYSKYFKLEYKTLHRTGDRDELGNIIGAVRDIKGNYLTEADGTVKVSVHPDENDIFFRAGKYHLLTHFEGYPGLMYITELGKNDDGSYRSVLNRYIDFSSIGGMVFTCAGSHTEWDTHLAGEEDYIFDSYYFDPYVFNYFGSNNKLLHISRAPCTVLEPWTCEQWELMRLYTGLNYPANSTNVNVPVDNNSINNYNYGYITEVQIDNKLQTVSKKHYVMGKYTPETALVMPDKKTAYMTDDGSFGGFYMFIANTPGDLSAGTLYMMKWNQTSPKSSEKGDTSNGGVADITWYRLGSSTDDEVKSIIDKRPLLSDIFEISNVRSDNTTCKAVGAGYKLITAGAYDFEYRGINICLRLRDGSNGTTISSKFSGAEEVKKAAAFLETRKYGAYLGATSEFEKEEGLRYNADNNVVYIAMGRLRFGMQDLSASGALGPIGGDDHVQLDRNDCGAIYEMKLGSNQKDTNGNSIPSDYVGTRWAGLVVGKRLRPGDQFADKNRCHPDFISLPDAINYFNGTLFIGEDSSSHFNNTVWAYDIATKKLTRIMTIPTGAEVSGGFVPLEDENRLNIFVNVQHPLGDEAFDGNTEQPVNWSYINNASKDDKRAYIGYISGLPRITNMNAISIDTITKTPTNK